MFVVQHEFQDRFTGEKIEVGTIVELEEGERKKYLLENQIVATAKVVKLPNSMDKGGEEETKKEPKATTKKK